MILYLKPLISKVGSYNFKKIVEVADNYNKFNNDYCKDQLINWRQP